VTCVGRKKDTRRVQHNTRPAKRPVRAGRGTTRPELGPGDDRRVIDVAQRPCPHRHRERRGVPVARARPPVAPCRSEKSRIWLHKAETARTRSLPLIRPGAPRATFTAVGRGGRTRLRVYTLRRRPLLDLRRRLWPLPRVFRALPPVEELRGSTGEQFSVLNSLMRRFKTQGRPALRSRLLITHDKP
jgi:hypothetical protein